jgi:hypothetical protein
VSRNRCCCCTSCAIFDSAVEDITNIQPVPPMAIAACCSTMSMSLSSQPVDRAAFAASREFWLLPENAETCESRPSNCG